MILEEKTLIFLCKIPFYYNSTERVIQIYKNGHIISSGIFTDCLLE